MDTITNDRLSKIIKELEAADDQQTSVAKFTKRNGSYGFVTSRPAALKLGREILRAATEPSTRQPKAGVFCPINGVAFSEIQNPHAPAAQVTPEPTWLDTFLPAFLLTLIIGSFAMLGVSTVRTMALDAYLQPEAKVTLPFDANIANSAMKLAITN